MRARISGLALAAFLAITIKAAASPYVPAERVRQVAIFAPRPAYPKEARLAHIQGSGSFKLIVRVKTGLIRRIVVFRSAGSSILDAAAIQTLQQWRFWPGVLPSMRKLDPSSKEPDADKDACLLVPISFVL